MSEQENNEHSEAEGRSLAPMAGYALFAGGHYYPHGGWGDMRGLYKTVEQCRIKFHAIGKDLMSEQGYGKIEPRGGDVWGEVVDLDKMEVIERLKA